MKLAVFVSTGVCGCQLGATTVLLAKVPDVVPTTASAPSVQISTQ